MTTCNDVVAIFFFGVFLSIVFSTGKLQDQLLQGPIGIGIGIVYGFVTGLVLCFMPSNKAKYIVGIRFVLIFAAGVFSVLGSKAIKYPSAGALGCITISFVAGTGWRKHTGKEDSDVGVYLDVLWKFLKPISFSLIGKEVYFKVLDGNTVLYGIIILVIGSILRLICAYASSYGGELNWKEKAYITISSFPKATVQAALGPVALDLARQLNSTEHMAKANTILIVSVLAIILTAPLGAVLMTKLSTKWLKRSPISERL
jgi:NhaP-type Na+/H+ or K+/H+ antiporter